MDPLDFLEPKQLLRFLHCKKTELSCMENPRIFLNQLRDHNLLPEDRYKKIRDMRSKEKIEKALYDILDWLERERSQHIHLFWSCVFTETIINKYPNLRLMRHSLMDGSFSFNTQLPEKVEKEETSKRKGKEVLEDEKEEKENSVSKRGKRRKKVCDDDEEVEEQQPGPSSQSTPGQSIKSRKICFYSPLKRGEKSDIWNWPLYKSQLPVTCGSQEGALSRDRLTKGEKCIAVKSQWFTPSGFERFAGKTSYKNWKMSIRCHGTPLGNLIKEGHLKAPRYRRRNKKQKAKRSLFPADQSITVSDEEEGGQEEEEEEDEEEDDEDDLGNQEDQVSCSTYVTDEDGGREQQPDEHNDVFEVTCKDVAGALHLKRFVSGTKGKCIRTETSWLSPIEFVKIASPQTNMSWKREIICKGKPIGVLIEAKILKIHSLLCKCGLCKPDRTERDNQRNDDECCVCKRADEELVMCDDCPRSFHQKCHLPPLDDAALGDSTPWMCTFCVANQEWRHNDGREMEVALSLPVSKHLMECQYLLLNLYTTDVSRTIASISRIEMDTSSSVNQTPLWLDNLAKNLETEKYQQIRDFVSDVDLFLANFASEKQDNSEVLSVVGRLKEIFNQTFNRVFDICEERLSCLH